MTDYQSFLLPPILHVDSIDRAYLNRCLVDWDHKMGPFSRPSYAIEAHFALFSLGKPVAVVATSESVREVIGDTGLRRDEVVELARLCAARPDLCRVMLRIWREFLYPAVAAAHGRSWAISYQDKNLHTGDVYRFDGWRQIGTGGGGGRDSRTGRPGRKLAIWGWPREISAEVSARKEAKAA